jgi:hypothetical protein
MHILSENLRFALTVPFSTARLRCSLFSQTALLCKNPVTHEALVS